VAGTGTLDPPGQAGQAAGDGGAAPDEGGAGQTAGDGDAAPDEGGAGQAAGDGAAALGEGGAGQAAGEGGPGAGQAAGDGAAAPDEGRAAGPPPPPPEDSDAAEVWRRLAEHRRGTLQRRDALDWTLLGDRRPLVAAAAGAGPAAAGGPGGWGRLAAAAASRIAPWLRRAAGGPALAGVRLSFLSRFVADCGGPAALAGRTTAEVVDRFVRPRAAASGGLSLCAQLASGGGGGAALVAPARAYVVHAWGAPFLDTLAALERRFSAGPGGPDSEVPDPALWFDVFSAPQPPAAGARGEEGWWAAALPDAIAAVGEAVVVLQPWPAPAPLARLWCLFEAHAARARLSVAMAPADADRLAAAVCRDPAALLATLRRRVCCEAGAATRPEDREGILSAVRRPAGPGLARLDAAVAAALAEAVCAELRRQADDGATEARQAARLLLALARLRGLQQLHAEAEALHRECLGRAAAAGLGADLRLPASVGIAGACARQGKGIEAREAYRAVLDSESLGPRDRLVAASGLALECHAVADAELRAEADGLAAQCEAEGGLRACGAALRHLGALRLAQGRAADAERLLRAAVDALRGEAGEWSPLAPWHPDTLDAAAGVADAAAARGGRAEAEEGLRGILALRERYLGPEHADARATRARLAALGAGGAQGGAASRSSEASAGAAGDSKPPGMRAGSGSATSESGQARPAGGGGGAPPIPTRTATTRTPWDSGGGAATTAAGVLARLWQDLPGLEALQALQLRNVQGLDRETWICLATKALGAPSLRSVDLRWVSLSSLSPSPSPPLSLSTRGSPWSGAP
jgi:hypothetical protein